MIDEFLVSQRLDIFKLNILKIGQYLCINIAFMKDICVFPNSPLFIFSEPIFKIVL